MATDTAEFPSTRRAHTHAARAPRGVVATVTGRKAVRSGLVWGFVFGAYVALQATTYARSYKTPASRALLAQEFGDNAGISALVGPGRALDTVGGFTAWKCLMVLAITGSVWGILTATRLLRGEEDAGRWEVLLAGRTTRGGAAAQAVVGLAGGVVTLFTLTALIVVAAGHTKSIGFATSGSLYFSLAVAAGPLMFLAVGALASQLAATRRQATTYAAGFLGVAYALRMVADSGTGLTWLRWLSPLGWITEAQPLTDPRPVAFVPIAAFTVVTVAATLVLAARRDLGASRLPDRASARAHLGLLGGPLGLTVRLVRPTLVAWAVSVLAYGLLLGSIAKSGGRAITSSPSLKLVFERLGVSGPAAYVGIALLLMAVALAFVAVGQVNAAWNEESSGRLEFLLVRPLSRVRWLATRGGVAAVAIFLLGVLAGVAVWAGAAAEHAGIGFPTLVRAGVNVVPPSLFVLGVGVLGIGVWPRVSTRVTYGVVVWSLLVELMGGIVHVNHWVLDSSVFHQMAPAPSAPIDLTADLVMTLLAAALVAVGVAAFRRRDLVSE